MLVSIPKNKNQKVLKLRTFRISHELHYKLLGFRMDTGQRNTTKKNNLKNE